MLFLSYSLHELTLYTYYYPPFFFVLIYTSSFRSKKDMIDRYTRQSFIRLAIYSYSLKNIDIMSSGSANQRTNERMKRRKWCILNDILRFIKWILIHASNHGEKWGSSGYHLKKKKKISKKKEEMEKRKKKREWNTEANVSNESPMNFPAVKRTAFWLLTISIFVIFCRL